MTVIIKLKPLKSKENPTDYEQILANNSEGHVEYDQCL